MIILPSNNLKNKSFLTTSLKLNFISLEEELINSLLLLDSTYPEKFFI